MTAEEAAALVPRVAELPPTLASQIAAGEVIERPAAVVKELLDNSLDAGAGAVVIDVAGGGRQRIAVSDDGHGIHPDDMEPALRRHSTSKLTAQSDLSCITSLGFRGEALASIAGVSQFSLASRAGQFDTAWVLSFDPVSGHSELKPAARSRGTTVEAANIFQSTPARRKFLRSPRTEFLHILEVVKRAACSRFDVAFTLNHDGKQVLRYRPCEDNPRERVADIFGGRFAAAALPVRCEARGMRLWGWLGGCELSRSQSDQQFFFVNGRVIRDRKTAHAARAAFGDSLPPGRYPAYLLRLEIDPAVVDVNVHPTKSEIRFRDTHSAYDFIRSALQEAQRQAGALNLEEVAGAATGGRAGGYGGQAGAAAGGRAGGYGGQAGDYGGRAETYRPTASQVRDAALFFKDLADGGKQDDLLRDNAGLGAPLAALGERAAVARRDQELVLIDYQEARKYLLRYRLRRDHGKQSVRRRPLLVPVDLETEPARLELAEKYADALEGIGLSLRQAAANVVSVKAIPALLEEGDVKQMTQAVLERLPQLQDGADPGPELLEALLENVGEWTAAPSLAELQTLLNDLDRTDLDTRKKRFKGMWRVITPQEIGRMING